MLCTRLWVDIIFSLSRSCGTARARILLGPIALTLVFFFISPLFFFYFFFTLLKIALQVATPRYCGVLQVYVYTRTPAPPVLYRLFADYLSLRPGPAGKLVTLRAGGSGGTVVPGRPAMGKFGAVPVTRRRVTGCGRLSQMRALAAWQGPVAGAYRSPDHRRPMLSYKGTRAPSLLNAAPRLPAVFLVRVAAALRQCSRIHCTRR